MFLVVTQSKPSGSQRNPSAALLSADVYVDRSLTHVHCISLCSSRFLQSKLVTLSVWSVKHVRRSDTCIGYRLLLLIASHGVL